MLSRTSFTKILKNKNNIININNIVRYHGSDSHDDFKVKTLFDFII